MREWERDGEGRGERQRYSGAKMVAVEDVIRLRAVLKFDYIYIIHLWMRFLKTLWVVNPYVYPYNIHLSLENH